MHGKILPRIHCPRDLDSLSMQDLYTLADEIRERIIDVTSENGGHLSPNLGTVELTIALHKVFHVPQDKIIFDVGHQSYTHKILTGRNDTFDSLRQLGGLCGFTKMDESEYDCFGAGHAGTSISAAMGYSAARELSGGHENIVAVIGDGSLICGIPLEAMNDLRATCKNMIIILNDNKMSISQNIGAIPNYLNRIITGRNYNRFKMVAKKMLNGMPGGEKIVSNIQVMEAAAKSFFLPGIFFEEMGIRYIGPINGHKLENLIQTLERVKEFNRPVLVHVVTEKGHGCSFAEKAPERYHGIGKFNKETGVPVKPAQVQAPSFSQVLGTILERTFEQDPKAVLVTAAMAGGCGISGQFIERYQGRFFDTGIAEEHAVVFAAGLAAAGYHPVVTIYATFLQRALDCIFHDICLQDLPVIFCEDRAGIVEDGPTHHGIYDVSFLRAMPNLQILAPADGTELDLMMKYAVSQKHPVAIRYPKSPADQAYPDSGKYPVETGKGVVVKQGYGLSIFAAGREIRTALQTADLLKAAGGPDAAVIDVRFLKPLDKDLLLRYAEQGPVVTIEDHVKTGGLYSAVSEILGNAGCSSKVIGFGWDADKIVPHGKTVQLRETFGMTPQKIADSLKSAL